MTDIAIAIIVAGFFISWEIGELAKAIKRRNGE